MAPFRLPRYRIAGILRWQVHGKKFHSHGIQCVAACAGRRYVIRSFMVVLSHISSVAVSNLISQPLADRMCLEWNL